METRMQKWFQKRAEIEIEAKEIANALKIDEKMKIFDEMMGEPIKQLEELINALN